MYVFVDNVQQGSFLCYRYSHINCAYRVSVANQTCSPKTIVLSTNSLQPQTVLMTHCQVSTQPPLRWGAPQVLAHSKDATFFSNMTGASNPGQIIVKVLVKVVSKVGKGGHKMFTLHNINIYQHIIVTWRCQACHLNPTSRRHHTWGVWCGVCYQWKHYTCNYLI